MANKMISLRSSNGDILQMEERAAKQSKLIQFMIEDGYADDVIPVQDVDNLILAKVIDYCNRLADPADEYFVELNKFDEKFVKVDWDTLIRIIAAANYLDIPRLLYITTREAAHYITTNPLSEELSRFFNIKNDFSAEEEDEIRQQNPFAFN